MNDTANEKTELPLVVPLRDASNIYFGGKAVGLAGLIKNDLQVPAGFVVTAMPKEKLDFDSIEKAYQKLGEPRVAVRSSASCEDGHGASFAGQFETILDVKNRGELKDAVNRCFRSFNSGGIDIYKNNIATVQADTKDADIRSSGHHMCVIVQKMVPAKLSGVLFTVDPISQNKGVMKLEALSGMGEQLVSGLANASVYKINKTNLVADCESGEPLLGEHHLEQLAKGALLVEQVFSYPLDMEWAIDDSEKLQWLQARPITTLTLPTAHEFDYIPARKDQLFTRANIGEMLPGAATPLTISVFSKAVDAGMWALYKASGVQTRQNKSDVFVCSFQGNLFFNLSLVYDIVGRVMGTSLEALEVSLLGRKTSDRPMISMQNSLVRLVNLFRYVGYLFGHKRAIKKAEKLLAVTFDGFQDGTPESIYAAISSYLRVYYQTTVYHMQVSAFSGAMNGALRGMFDKAGIAPETQLQILGDLLRNIDDIESAQIIKELEVIGGEIKNAFDRGTLKKDVDADALDQWLNNGEIKGKAQALFLTFIKKHGHRCVREVELMAAQWSDDTSELAHTLLLIAKNEKEKKSSTRVNIPVLAQQLKLRYPKLSLAGVKKVAEWARGGVSKREFTKSIMIKINSRLRSAYRNLAVALVGAGKLPDEASLFFMTHLEIGQFLAGETKSNFLEVIKRRRDLYPEQMTLRFPDFCTGTPVPVTPGQIEGTDNVRRQGLPISPGKVKGIVRVVLNTQDAKQLKPGEIMCSRFTDVGWTPYYGIIGGLITEIGSSLSHGAVVAREYGLPLVSNIDGATQLFQDGDLVELSGYTGNVRTIKTARA